MRFDDVLFEQDLARARSEGKRVAQEARTHLQGAGIDVGLLMRCDDEARDGTRLGGLVKLYLPIPYGPWGLVLAGAGGREDPHLQALAFGERHPARRPSVYDIAHHRRHGHWPAGMRSGAP